MSNFDPVFDMTDNFKHSLCNYYSPIHESTRILGIIVDSQKKKTKKKHVLQYLVHAYSVSINIAIHMFCALMFVVQTGTMTPLIRQAPGDHRAQGLHPDRPPDTRVHASLCLSPLCPTLPRYKHRTSWTKFL